MSQVATKVDTHFLLPSNVFISQRPTEVTTILGSCVAVCVFDASMKLGGINHYMLPLWNGKGFASPKFGNIAIDKLFTSLYARGCKKEDLIIKVFGGSEQMSSIWNIGGRNIQVIQKYLKNHGLEAKAQNTGGARGRKIIFHTHTGEIKLKFLGQVQ